MPNALYRRQTISESPLNAPPSGQSVSVAVFTAREDRSTLERTVRAASLAAAHFKAAVIDVLVNGNPVLAEAFRGSAHDLPGNVALRLWSFSKPDKANTWNVYVHSVVPDVALSFFVDGYAAVDVNSLVDMHAAFSGNPQALAISGVQSMGPSAKTLLRRQLSAGGICGNLYALPAETIRRIRSSSFRMPLGIYRTDPSLGAALCFNLDPSQNDWNPARLLTVPSAGFQYRAPRPWRFADWRALLRRRLRQARGMLESRALRQHFEVDRRSPSELPSTAFDLVTRWCDSQQAECRQLLRRSPIVKLAYRQLLKDGPPSFSTDAGTLLVTKGQVLG
jgi:hypothetical protein